MDLIQQLKHKAQENPRKIVLPEGNELRTLKAADQVLQENIAELILLGNAEEIKALAQEHQLTNIQKASIIDPKNHPKKEEYIQLLLELRKAKGLTREEAEILVENPLYCATLMIKAGDAEGEVAGARSATGDVLRPAFQIIKTKPWMSVVSGAFLMIFPEKTFGEEGVMIFADCAVNPNPTAPELAQIALASAQTAKVLGGFEPKIAMLSFSTKGSAKHQDVSKVIEATQILQETNPDLKVEGELQADAAIIPSIGQQKAPGSEIAGQANVLVFPDLDAGNISYKLAQRFGNAEAIGPILQGIAAPINDLSRGCSVEDIIKVIIITANQALANS